MISVTVPVSYFFTHFHYNCYNHFSYLLPVQLMLMLAFHFCCIIVNSRFKTRLHLISTCSARTLTLIILDNQTVFVNSSSIECIMHHGLSAMQLQHRPPSIKLCQWTGVDKYQTSFSSHHTAQVTRWPV